MSGRLEAIWIKRGRGGPMDPVPTVAVEAGQGLAGNANRTTRRQITILQQESWERVMAALEAEADPSIRRANLMVSGVPLAGSRGRVLKVGTCRIRIEGETRPCEAMDTAVPGLRAALSPDWNGGAYGVALDDGAVAVGDDVAWEADGRETRGGATAGFTG